MALLLHEIAWEDPLFPATEHADWEAEVAKTLGDVHPWAHYVGGSSWLRDALLDAHRVPLAHTPGRFIGIAQLVAAQENACRYCYGVMRSVLRITGTDEATISRLERDTQLADSDELERVFVTFCRNLARSNPRPALKERRQLEALGLEPIAVAEIACWIALMCMVNRCTTMLAVPPYAKIETRATSWWGKLLRPHFARGLRARKPQVDYSHEGPWEGPYGRLVELLEGSPCAPVLGHALRGCFTTGPLSREAKLLIFAVVARSLQCSLCVREAGKNLDVADDVFEATLSTLSTEAIPEQERGVLPWARETVWYETADVQRKTQVLFKALGKDRTVDAIGAAALANACVRMAMLAK